MKHVEFCIGFIFCTFLVTLLNNKMETSHAILADYSLSMFLLIHERLGTRCPEKVRRIW